MTVLQTVALPLGYAAIVLFGWKRASVTEGAGNIAVTSRRVNRVGLTDLVGVAYGGGVSVRGVRPGSRTEIKPWNLNWVMPA